MALPLIVLSTTHVHAEYQPAPGNLVVHNALSAGVEGCEGNVTLRYGILPEQAVRTFRASALADCSVEVTVVPELGQRWVPVGRVDGRVTHSVDHPQMYAWHVLDLGVEYGPTTFGHCPTAVASDKDHSANRRPYGEAVWTAGCVARYNFLSDPIGPGPYMTTWIYFESLQAVCGGYTTSGVEHFDCRVANAPILNEGPADIISRVDPGKIRSFELGPG